MKLTHSEAGERQDKAAAKPRVSEFKRYMIIGAAAFGIGAMAMPSCGSNNTDSVINLPPISSDGGVDGTVTDGGPADSGSCILPPGACTQQVVQNQTLNISDSVVIGGYRFVLMGTGESDGNQFAVFGILDACGNPMQMPNIQIARGQTQNIHIDGTNEDIALSVPSITVLSPQTATVSATVTCGGATDAGTTTDSGVHDGGAGGSDGGAGGSDGGSGGMDSGVSDGGAGGSDGGAGGMDSGVSDGGSGGMDSGVSDGGAGGMDSGVSDGGSGGMDAGLSDAGSGGLDSGVSDAGSGGMDSGVSDAGSGGSDGGSVCAVASTGSFVGFIGLTTTVKVGGYSIGYDGVSGSDALVDVNLGSCSIGSSVHCPIGSTTNIDDTANGKQIQVHVLSATSLHVSVSISVVNH